MNARSKAAFSEVTGYDVEIIQISPDITPTCKVKEVIRKFLKFVNTNYHSHLDQQVFM
jgi:hypothetical protein